MKRILFLMSFFVFATIAWSPDARAAEACGGWWNPCCPWWEPWKCAATKERKKQVAEYVENYTKRRGVDILAIGGALRFIPGAGNAVGNVIGPVALTLAVYAEKSGAVRKDPFRWDFLEFYSGDWQQAWDYAVANGFSYTGWYWTDELTGNVVGLAYYTDYITNEADRFTSCMQMGQDCPDWVAQAHKDNVAWGFYMYGYYHGAFGDHLWNVAWLVEQEQQQEQGQDPELIAYLVSVLREAASVADYAEQEYENDWD